MWVCMFLAPFASFAYKLVMALVGGGGNVPVQEESNDHSEVVKANGEVDEGLVSEDGGTVPKDGVYVPSVGSEVQVPTENLPVLTVRKRGRPRFKPNLSNDETSVKNVVKLKKDVKPKEKVDEAPRFQPTTPVSSDRPVREKKSVRRFISVSSEEASRVFIVEKGSGSGTALKDIPNVAYKLSRKSKADPILKLLHTVIYGKRVKVVNIKNNILQFSGFEQGENKNDEKVKEKLEKLHKENLANLCDFLDLQISKTTTKKDELVAKLLEFLEAPCMTQNVLTEEKEQNSKHKKRKRADGNIPGKTLGEITGKEVDAGGNAAYKEHNLNKSESGKELEKLSTEKESLKEKHVDDEHESKRKNSNRLAKKGSKTTDENVEKREDEKQGKQFHGTEPSISLKSTDKKSKRKEIDANLIKHKDETEDKIMPRKVLKRNSKVTNKKDIGVNNEVLEEREDAEMNAKRKDGGKPSQSKLKNPGDNFLDAKEAFRNDQHMSEKIEATYGRKESKTQTDRMAEAKIKLGVRTSVPDPTEEELRFIIRELLNEVDFNTATLSDVVKRLGRHFDKDFTEKKAYIRILVQEELTKIAEDDDEDNHQDEI